MLGYCELDWNIDTMMYMVFSGLPRSDQDKIPCVFGFFPVFFHRQKIYIIVCKWPPPPL